MRCATRCRSLQERQRAASDAAQKTGHALADIEARAQALAALQAKIGQGKDSAQWLAEHGLANARRLWQGLDIEPGWEDALEAVLRERLDAVELARLDAVGDWVHEGDDGGRAAADRRLRAGDRPRRAAAAIRRRAARASALACARTSRACSPTGCAACVAATTSPLRLRERGIARRRRVVRHAAGPSRHRASRSTSSRRTAICTACSRASASSPSSSTRSATREQLRDAARDALAAVECRARRRAAGRYHAESLAFSSQQRRCHDLELELLQLKQAAEAAAKRRAQIARSCAEIAAAGSGRAGAQGDALAARACRRAGRRCTTRSAKRDAARNARNDAEVALARGRERVRARRARRAGGGLRRAQLPRAPGRARAPARSAGRARSRSSTALLAQLTSERAAIDWTPVEEALQRQLAARGEAEQALAAARDRQEGARRRAARRRRGAARRASRSSSPRARRSRRCGSRSRRWRWRRSSSPTQLAEAHADVAALPAALKAFGNKSGAARRDRAAAGGDRRARRRQSRRARRARDRDGAQAVPRRAGGRPDRGDGHARERDPPDRPRIAAAAAADVRHGQRELRAALPGAVRRRPGAARADRRGDSRFRRAGRRAAARASATRRSTFFPAARRR